jgi:hypothetical protein
MAAELPGGDAYPIIDVFIKMQHNYILSPPLKTLKEIDKEFEYALSFIKHNRTRHYTKEEDLARLI